MWLPLLLSVGYQCTPTAQRCARPLGPSAGSSAATTSPLVDGRIGVAAAAASGLEGGRAASPRMAVLDSMLRRGSAAETEADSAFYSAADNEAAVGAYQERVERINAMEDAIEELSDEDLAAKTGEFRARLSAGETTDQLLEEAFAVVREAAWRTLELRHYDVQLVGAMGLHDGMLAQMGTGEGKTLVATCAVYLNALSGDGAMLVTVNDYLARRDAETMGQVYTFLGLSVGLVQQGMDVGARRSAYSKDVTYVTNSELGFDYLRDNLAMSPAEVVLPPSGLGFAVVDEGDSVLIDEARVPLIISGRTEAKVDKYTSASRLALTLNVGEHYEVYEKEQTVTLTEEGARFAEMALQVSTTELNATLALPSLTLLYTMVRSTTLALAHTLQVDDLYDTAEPWASYVGNALKAKECFARDKEYIVRDDEVLIVDEFSGRVMDGRRWGDGLHQAIEAKEGVSVQEETEVIASITYQSLFRRFATLSSMTGTALTEAGEFATLYGLKVCSGRRPTCPA